jgi:hypothetical protein
MTASIPPPIISLVSQLLSAVIRNSHDLDVIFERAGAPPAPPNGSVSKRTEEWLRRINESHPSPLNVLGKVVAVYLDTPDLRPGATAGGFLRAAEGMAIAQFGCDFHALLEQHKMEYRLGGVIVGPNVVPASEALASFVKTRNMRALDLEFDRALRNVDINAREAVSAASNILEVVCKYYISENGLNFPSMQDVQSLFKVVRKHLGLDPNALVAEDIRTISSGLGNVISGVGSLRTHASSAHGQGPESFELPAYYARFAVHSSHAATLFLLEAWNEKIRSMES